MKKIKFATPQDILKYTKNELHDFVLYINTQLTGTSPKLLKNKVTYTVMIKEDRKTKTYDYPFAKPFSLDLLVAAIAHLNEITLWHVELVDSDEQDACKNYMVRFTARDKTTVQTDSHIEAIAPLDALAEAWDIEPNQVCIKKIIATINDRISAWKAPDMEGEPLRSPGDIYIYVRVYVVKDHLRSHSPIDVLTAFDHFKKLGWTIKRGFDQMIEDGYYYEFSYQAHS